MRLKYYNNEKFHSKIEIEVYKILLKYFERRDFERQKRYFDNRKFTCDFYFGNLNPPTWIEVSNYLKPHYLSKIKKKRKWIEEDRKEIFLFISDPLILENQLNNWRARRPSLIRQHHKCDDTTNDDNNCNEATKDCTKNRGKS